MFLYLNNSKTEYVISSACNFIQRASGLIFRKKLLANEAFYIQPCNSVHTFGMKYAIDIVYLDKTGVILKITKNMQKRRISWCFKAHSVLEFKSNASDLLAMQIGDVVSFLKFDI
jgi:uncharacterized membrane protein (UPF0127 family)